MKRPVQTVSLIKDVKRKWSRNDVRRYKFSPSILKTSSKHSHQNQQDGMKMNLEALSQMDLHIKRFKASSSWQISFKKKPRFDFITGEILQEVHANFNIRIQYSSYFLQQWIVAQIIPQNLEKYCCSNVLQTYKPMLSKIFEQLRLIRLKAIMEKQNIVPYFTLNLEMNVAQ